MLILLNRHEIGARRGADLSARGHREDHRISQLGRLHELRRPGPVPGRGRTGCPSSTSPARPATPRMLAMEFARFLGLPLRTRANITDITNAVCGPVDARTDLVLVDEIHNINPAPAGAEVSDT